MREITNTELDKERFILFIYTPFCGTCGIARTMLEKIESIHDRSIFFQMNANYHEDFLQKYRVESVPCLLIKDNEEVKEKVYTFYSTGNIYRYLYEYTPELFASN